MESPISAMKLLRTLEE